MQSVLDDLGYEQAAPEQDKPRIQCTPPDDKEFLGEFSATERGNPDLMASRVKRSLAKTTKGLIEAAALVNSAWQACKDNEADWHRFLRQCAWDRERDRKHIEALVQVGREAEVLWDYADVLPRSLYTLRFLCSRAPNGGLRIVLHELRAKNLISSGLTLDGLKNALGLQRNTQKRDKPQPYVVSLVADAPTTHLDLAAVAIHCVLQHVAGKDYSAPFEYIRRETWLKPFLRAVAWITLCDTKPLIDAMDGHPNERVTATYGPTSVTEQPPVIFNILSPLAARKAPPPRADGKEWRV